MAIGTPVAIGQNSAGSSAALGVTTTASVVSGDLILVAIAYNSVGQTVSGVSDGVNTYAKAVGAKNGGGGNDVWYVANATAFASGTVVTATFTGSAAQPIVEVARVTGVSSTPLDKTATSATSSSTSAVSGTLTQADELIIGTLGGFNFTAITEDAVFTNIYSIQQNASQVWENFAYKIVNSTASVTYAPTFTGGGGNQVYAIATFKGAASAGTQPLMFTVAFP